MPRSLITQAVPSKVTPLAEKQFLTPPEASKLLGVAREKILGWISSGELLASNISNGNSRPRYLIARDSLDALLLSRSNCKPSKKPRKKPRPKEAVEQFV